MPHTDRSVSAPRGVRLALDWGQARIGVAACDPAGTLAYPVQTVAAGPDAHRELSRLLAEYEPSEVIVGLPRSLDGTEGIAAGKIRQRVGEFADFLRAEGHDATIRLVDERLSTVTASRRMSASGKSTRKQRSVIDQGAAMAILESVLEREASTGISPGEVLSSRPG